MHICTLQFCALQLATINLFQMRISKIIIRGEEQSPALIPTATDDILELKKSYAVGTAVRGVTEVHAVDIEADDIVEVVYDEDISWLCNSDTLAELFPEVDLQKRSVDDVFVLPVSISSPDAERGGLGNIFLKFFRIFKKKPGIVGRKIRDLASDLEKKHLGNQIGLFRVDAGFQLQPFAIDPAVKNYLLFLHGTNSSTEKSFGDILGTPTWAFLQQTFGTNILAFQHESLTKSPLENTLDLLNALPAQCELQVVSQSRGGLIGDLLCRFCGSDEHQRGFSETELKAFRDAKREDDLKKIDAILKALRSKKITVKKFVRVACPGGGTTLASKRLDDFFNVTFNLIGVAAGITTNPIFGVFKNLLVSVINTKNDVDILPGVEAMSKESPFIKILNQPATEVVIDTPLVVIAGNCKARVSLKGLLIIASKLFFRQKNDLIVDTKSMTLGAQRTVPVQRFFDEGVDVDHFHYFKNKGTNEALLRALQSRDDTQPIPGFSFETGSRAITGDRNALVNFGLLEGGQLFSSKVTGSKPIVILLPGIMGSNLAEKNKTLWIDYLGFLGGGLMKLSGKNVEATSLVKTSYKKLNDYLSDSYDVVTFPFDWRKHLNDTAKLLNDKIIELLEHRQPIKLIGHSMGGVLIRDFIINYPDTWKLLNTSPGFRVIFLGSPLGGSFRIPAVLFGNDAIINKLSKIDILHSKKDLLEMFSKMEGLLSLLPLSTDAENDFANVATWERMRDPFGKDWPIPKEARLLGRFKDYRDRVLAKLDEIDYSNIVYIAGRDKATPCGYRIEKRAGDKEELVFLSTAEGDQSVTWETGIPRKMIENDSVYYVNVTHGALANEPSIFKGISEILANGFTRLLSKTRPVVRGEEKLFRSPQPDDFDLTPAGVENTILGLSDEPVSPASERLLTVSVTKGDLRYASHPVLVGHFNGDGIVSAEKAINRNLDGALSQRHRLGLYPGKIGTHEILIPGDEDFKGVIIVGLGEPGCLTGYQLSQTVEQGIAKYLLMLNSKHVDIRGIGISPLIIGSGYGGLSVEGSIRAIIEGVINANNKVRSLFADDGSALIEHIEFVELYEDIALNAFQSLSKLEKTKDSLLTIALEPKKMVSRLGARKRLASSTTEEWWTRVTVKVINDAKDRHHQGLRFTISTGGAREEQRTLDTTKGIIEELVREMSTDNRWTPALAKTLFELLIPTDFKEQLKRQNNINWIVDDETAPFPWELLQDGTIATARPLCVNAGMVRQLATENYRVKINAVNNSKALVIADPNLKGFASQLAGAKEEGKLVTSILSSNGFEPRTIINESSFEIMQALFSDEYKIIHLAGHGIFNADPSKGSGMLIGDNVFLSTREINQMSMTPEFVFVNCCFLGKSDAAADKYFQDRFRLAANIGTQLINNGVKAVIAAGWAVDDAAALEFTEVFYKSMFEGYNFGEALKNARQRIYDKYGYTNTWGAYQCYGDQYYRFNISKSAKPQERVYFISEEAEIELHNLQSMGETGQYESDQIIKWLEEISASVDKAGLRTPAITEKEAFIYADLYEYDRCISKLEALFQTERAGYSVAAFERYCNIRAGKYTYDYLNKKGSQGAYLTRINHVIRDLGILLDVSPTVDRTSIMGSAHKRKGLLSKAGDKGKIKAYAEAARYYRDAYLIKSNADVIYPLSNWLALESILRLTGNNVPKKGLSKADIEKNEEAYAKALAFLKKEENNLVASGDVTNYWDLSKSANAKLTLLIATWPGGGTTVKRSRSTGAKKAMPKTRQEVFEAYKKLWERAGSKGKKWAEIEHLLILMDMLSTSRKQDAIGLRKVLNELKEDLEKIV
jgi:CHAT domain-containing protein/pimeloyl-ACP methyl ester carboxylesterase